MPATVDHQQPQAAVVSAAGAYAGWRSALLWVVAGELVLLFAPTLRFLYERWTVSVWQNAHGLFVPPLVAWLAWQELKPRTALPVQGSA
jgi:hypothetical protein